MISIIPCYDITLRNLQELTQKGYSVSRSSHAGNYSFPKLLLFEAGIPDCLWDITCMYRDANNAPRYKFLGGMKIPLLEGEPPSTHPSSKHLTAYQKVQEGGRLAHVHVAPLRKLYGDLVTSQSRELLRYRERLLKVFEVAAAEDPSLFNRYVLPCGCMVETVRRGDALAATCAHGSATVSLNALAASALQTLAELDRLFFDPEGCTPKGGPLYSFEFAQTCYYLVTSWRFGEKPIYELSGSTAIRYMTKDGFIRNVERILLMLKRHLSKLVPDRIEARVVPGRAFTFGYPKGHADAEMVMNAHERIMTVQSLKRRYLKVERRPLFEANGEFKELARNVESCVEGIVSSCDRVIAPLVGVVRERDSAWRLFGGSDDEAFFSQHDLAANGGRMELIDAYRDTPFRELMRILDGHKQRMRTFTKRFFPAPAIA